MITTRPAQARGKANFGWLDTQHTFSFGHYYDPNQMGFASLRVINEDKVAPGKGFATHGHRDMEIITYVLEGALEHKDSIGTGSVIRPGDVQRMSAGTGIQHSEFNASLVDPVHLLQIWILPTQQGLTPDYEQKNFPVEERSNQLRLVGSQNGRDGSITVHQDVSLYASVLEKEATLNHTLAPNRLAWLQVARGALRLNGQLLTAGDGAAIEHEPHLTLQSVTNRTEILLFDLAA